MGLDITFQDLFDDSPDNLNYYLEGVFGLLHEEASSREIEFNGYFKNKWNQSADTIFGFDENYFSNIHRRNLYVYKAAEVDEEIFKLLQTAYKIANLNPPIMNDIHCEIFEHEEKGVKF